MNASFFVRGLLIGFSIAATVGPMSILCIQRTIHKGQRFGLVSGLGIATADALYGSIAAFGLTAISQFLVSQHFWLRLLGGAFLVYLGVKTLLSKPPERTIEAEKVNNFVAAYLSTLLLTLTNPLTILSFAAIFAGIGVGNASRSYASASIVVLGVFLGSTLWWCLLTSMITLLRRRFTPLWLLWINRASGVVITLFGVIALISLSWGQI